MLHAVEMMVVIAYVLLMVLLVALLSPILLFQALWKDPVSRAYRKTQPSDKLFQQH